ncbi:hypothetical protein Tco_1391780 [Tanacetum coccineum]
MNNHLDLFDHLDPLDHFDQRSMLHVIDSRFLIGFICTNILQSTDTFEQVIMDEDILSGVGYLSNSEQMLISSTEDFENLIATELSLNVMWQVSSVCCLFVLKTLKALETNENWTSKDMKKVNVWESPTKDFIRSFEMSFNNSGSVLSVACSILTSVIFLEHPLSVQYHGFLISTYSTNSLKWVSFLLENPPLGGSLSLKCFTSFEPLNVIVISCVFAWREGFDGLEVLDLEEDPPWILRYWDMFMMDTYFA